MILVIPSGLSIAATLAFLAPDAPRKAASWRPSDPIGAILSGLAATGLIISMGDPFGFGFTSWATLAVAVATIALVTWFIRWELRQATPVIDVRLFALPVVRIASTIRMLGFSAAKTLQLLLPIMLVSVRGVTPGTAGFIAAMMALGAKTAGPLYDRIGPRLPVMSGPIAQAALLLVFSRATSDTPIYWLAESALGFGVAQSIWNVPNNSALMGTPLDEVADVAGASASFERRWWFAFVLAASLARRTPVSGDVGRSGRTGRLSNKQRFGRPDPGNARQRWPIQRVREFVPPQRSSRRNRNTWHQTPLHLPI